MGNQLVNGETYSSARTLEFVLAMAIGGGERRQTYLLRNLFEGCASKSALPTLAYRARKLGIFIEYVPSRASYRMGGRISIDAIDLIDALNKEDLRGALDLYTGPCLARSNSPLATHTRELIDRRLAESAISSQDRRLLAEAAEKLDQPGLLSRERGFLDARADLAALSNETRGLDF